MRLLKRVLSFSEPTLRTSRLERRTWQHLVSRGIVEVGIGTYGIPRVHTFRADDTRLIIGRWSSIASGVNIILGGNHPADRISTYPFRLRYDLPMSGEDGFPSSNGDVLIGSDVWIGSGVTILSGVSIGHGCVVAAGAVLSGHFSPYSIIGGVPGRVLRPRFNPEITARIIATKWWDMPSEQVLDCVSELNSPDVLASLEFLEAKF